MTKISFFSSFLLLLLSNVLFADTTYTFGIVPQQNRSELVKNWYPILAYLEKKTGHKFHFKTAENIVEFEKQCAKGNYDIAYMNPYHYSVFHETSGYLAFAKQKDKKLQGILVTHVDNPIHNLADLIDVDDKTFAFPSPAAFAASILSRSQLNKLKIPFKAEYLSSHDNVYTSVKHKLYLVGGGIHRTLQKSTPTVRQDLKVIWESEEYTPHAFAALKSVKQGVINELTNALVNMFYDKEGRKMLLKIGFNQGIEAAYDKQWDDVRALKLETLKFN